MSVWMQSSGTGPVKSVQGATASSSFPASTRPLARATRRKSSSVWGDVDVGSGMRDQIEDDGKDDGKDDGLAVTRREW